MGPPGERGERPDIVARCAINSWKRVSPFGILVDGSKDAADSGAPWHSARLFDMLRVGGVASGPLLCASPFSGLWLVSSLGGPAIPLSWDRWGGSPPDFPDVWTGNIANVVCLAQGMSPEHVYAGGGDVVDRFASTHAALSETDVTQPAPLFHWRSIRIVGGANLQPLDTGAINRIVVVSQLQRLVLACDKGVFWAQIPPPGGTYIFQQAMGLPAGARFSGLALARGATVVAGAWGTDLGNADPADPHAGIFVGTWTGAVGTLNFQRAKVPGLFGLTRRVDLAGSPADPMLLYAVCGGGNPSAPIKDTAGNLTLDSFGNVQWTDDRDYIRYVLRSNDGGLTWRPTGSLVTGESQPLFGGMSNLAGDTEDGYTGCIGVSPFHPNLVAVGVTEPFLSRDNGATWTRLNDTTGPIHQHLHADIHALVFDPVDENTLYVCCDGGLVTTPDLGATWQSGANRQLPDLEFYKVAPSPLDSGLVAGSLQDNGNVYAPQYIDLDPWKALDGGDGVITQFVTTGDLLHTVNGVETKDSNGADLIFGSEVRAASWDNAARKFSDRSMFSTFPRSLGVIPVDGETGGLLIPDDKDLKERVSALELTEPVRVPNWKNEDGEPMVAVGARGIQVFGLFAKAGGNSHWTPIGAVDNLPDKDPMGNPKPYLITAVTSPDGTFIFAGTNNGKVFRLDASLAGAIFPFTNVSDPAMTVEVTRIVAFAPDQAFLIAGEKVFRIWIPPGGAIWTPLAGMVLPGGVSATLPVGQAFTCLAADPTTPVPALYVGTSFGIWVSEDNGESWLPFVEGLPRVPLCQELRWVQEASGVNFLYLATQGWSVFRRVLNVQEGAFSTLVVDGHMDLTDRVLLGDFTGDDYSLVVFNDMRTLGPFHPIDRMKFHGDEIMGGEISADLTLDLLWKIDSSIAVNASASMSAHDDDLSDSSAFTPKPGETLDVSFSMKSGEVEPDRVEIDFTATNV